MVLEINLTIALYELYILFSGCLFKIIFNLFKFINIVSIQWLFLSIYI